MCSHCKNCDTVAINDELAIFDRHLSLILPMSGVILEQVCLHKEMCEKSAGKSKRKEEERREGGRDEGKEEERERERERKREGEREEEGRKKECQRCGRLLVRASKTIVFVVYKCKYI